MGRTQSTSSEARQGAALAQHLRTRAVVICLLTVFIGACLFNWTGQKTRSVRSHGHEQSRTRTPAEQFVDNVVPFREQEPWDISVDYPYPRELSYEVCFALSRTGLVNWHRIAQHDRHPGRSPKEHGCLWTSTHSLARLYLTYSVCSARIQNFIC